MGQQVIDDGIGPWVLSDDKSSLIRRPIPASSEWPRQSGSWAQRSTIPVAPQKRHRVALVGESVARGFLLDPAVTLADLCVDAFAQAGQEEHVELLDLAVNNLSPDNALTLCRAAVELGSSVVVLFVGNNFLRSTPWLEPESRGAVADVLDEQGYAGYLAARRAAVAGLASRFREDLEQLRAQFGTTFVVVVPATNLLDWRSRWVVPTWLPQDRLERWAAAHEKLSRIPATERSAADEELEFALATELSELDGASTPRPLEIIGWHLVRRGRETEGLEMLDRAVSIGADPANYDRRCPPEVAAELRRLGNARGFRIVDLPARLRARFGAAAFSKKIFLDYCHHTLESLQWVAADIATDVLASADTAPRSSLSCRADVPATDLASAYLLSALHNQHWGQSAGTVGHWLAEAVRTDPKVVQSLATYFIMSTPDAQFWLTGEWLAKRSERMYWFLRNFSHESVLDAEFAERSFGVLPEPDADRLRGELTVLWQRLTVSELGEVDLLEPYWRERDGPPQRATVFTGESGPVCRYAFVASGAEALRLELVLAVGPGLPAGELTVMLNGQPCFAGVVGPEWTRHHVALPPQMQKDGLNELVFRWPTGSRSQTVMHSALADLGTGPENLHLVRIARMRMLAQR